jgi:hypothetical protein
MTREELLAQLETLTHAGRVQTMIELGRRSDAESQAIVSELEHGDFYERFMALYSCFGSRDSAHVLRALADPSRIIRGLALRLLPLVCDEAQLQNALKSAPAQMRLPLLWKLRQHQQQRAIDRFLETLAEQQDAQFLHLLPFGAPTLVARHTAQFRQQAIKADWKRLAHFHPTLALDLLRQWAGEASGSDQRLVNDVNALLPALIRVDAGGALALVIALRRTTPLKEIKLRNLQLLVKAAPKEMAELIWAERGKINGPFSAIVPWLSSEQIVTLYDERESIIGWRFIWSRYLTPEQRLAVYADGWKQFAEDDELADSIGALLPGERREQEARKHMARLRSDPEDQRAYIKFFPWDEALALLEPLLHDSDTSLRQEALQTLIEVVKYRRSRLTDALALLRTYRAEYDSVRRAFLESLGALPPGIWREEHLADLREIIRHGLNDAGLSPETLHVITNLSLKLLPVQLDWAAEQLATVLRERGLAVPKGRGNNRFPANLSDEQVQRLLLGLLPILQTWLEREKEDEILKVVEWFVRYRSAFEQLLPLLIDVLQQTHSRETAETIFGIIARQRFQSFHTLIPTLLEEDQSWITFSNVSAYLHRHRQDLLSPFLAFQPYAGRWSAGRKRFLLPLPRRFTGLPAQQERYANTLLEVIRDEAQESQVQTQAVKLLSQLPAIAPTPLIVLASDSRPVIRTSALFGLGRLDTDQGLPTLIESLQDARARIAVHALRSFLVHMPPAQALAIVRTIPMDRVTVAKERVRLTAEIHSEEAYQELLALEQSDLHRDVRLALLRALVSYLDRPATWAILEQAAQSGNIDIARDVLPGRHSPLQFQKQVQGEEATIEQHLLRVTMVQLHHPDQDMRRSAIRHCAWFEFKDWQGLLVPRLLEFLFAPTTDEYDAAVEAIFSVFVESEIPLITQAVRNLLPNRRVLDEIEDALDDSDKVDDPLFGSLTQALLPVLAEDPMTVTLRVKLAYRYLPIDDIAAFFEALAVNNELHAEALIRACDILAGWYRPAEIAQLEALETTLAASQDERLRRLALALLRAQSKKRRTWDRQRLARLRSYRADPSVLVAAAAQFTLPKEEIEDTEVEEE